MEAFTHAARTLGSLIEAQGPELLDDRRRTRSFLADLCPEARAPRAALDAALALGRARLSSPDSLALSESLARATALHPAVTRWAVGVLVALLTGRPLPPPPRVGSSQPPARAAPDPPGPPARGSAPRPAAPARVGARSGARKTG